LVVSPGRVPYPARPQWGFAAQLYATRSQSSWGIGDLGDLARLGHWSAGLGAGFALVSPLHAATPGPVIEPSPYFPGSRCFMNPPYLAVGDVPAVADVEELAPTSAAARALNDSRLVDRDRAWKLKSRVLEQAFQRHRGGEELELFRSERGRVLELF